MWSRLLQTAKPGDRTIHINSSEDWEVGDQITIGPSFLNYSETEYATIAEINDN